jgi:hypothetical protein
MNGKSIVAMVTFKVGAPGVYLSLSLFVSETVDRHGSFHVLPSHPYATKKKKKKVLLPFVHLLLNLSSARHPQKTLGVLNQLYSFNTFPPTRAHTKSQCSRFLVTSIFSIAKCAAILNLAPKIF